MFCRIEESVVIYKNLNSGNISVGPVSDILDQLLWIAGSQHDVILVYDLIMFILTPDHPPPDMARARDGKKKDGKE